MTVGELIERLRQMPQDLTVMGYSEDEELTPGPQPVPFFDLLDVQTFEVETHRGDDGRVKFHFESSDTSRTLVGIEMTLDY